MVNFNERIDLCGEVCPYPALYVKQRLNEMSAGEILEAIVDHVCAVEGVPSFAKNLGHEVLSIDMIENGLWRILVKVKG